MRLGSLLPIGAPAGGPLGARDVPDAAMLTEQLGYDSLWVFDAVGRGFFLPDPLLALTAAAAVTTRVELGTGVLQLPLRGTVDTAYRVLTLQHFAEGRLLLGIGAGSTRDDFDAFGASYDDRFSRFNAELPRFRDLLRTGRDPAGCADLKPWPSVQGGPQVLLAAWNGPWVERAATEADGWVASAEYNDDATLADAIGRYRDAGGRRAVVTHLTVGRHLGPAMERLHRFDELGFDDAIVLVRRPTEERLASVLAAAP